MRDPTDMNTYTEPVEPLGYCEYRSVDEVQPGDIVTMRQNLGHPGCCAFMTSIVEKIEPYGPDNRYIMVHLARPHANVSCPFGQQNLGSAYVAMEHYPVELDRFIYSYVRFTRSRKTLEPATRVH